MQNIFDSFYLASIPIEVEYTKVKTLRLTVHPPDANRTDCRVRISAPLGTAPEYIKKFAASKIEWIEKHREKFMSNPANTRPGASGSLRNQSTVYAWGNAYELELIERNGNPKIVLDGSCMKMFVRPLSTKAKKQELLDKWYRRALKEAAAGLIEKWEVN